MWNVEIKPGNDVTVRPGNGCCIDVTQATLGESDMGTESVILYISNNGQRHIAGKFNSEGCSQINLNLAFKDEFQISHTGLYRSVYLMGNKSGTGDTAVSESEREFKLVQPEIPTNVRFDPVFEAIESQRVKDFIKAGRVRQINAFQYKERLDKARNK